MDLLVIPFLILCLWGMGVQRDGFRQDYLSVDSTRALRGVLAPLVVLHHLYIEVDRGMLHLLISNVGVPCVVLFLFLSGYGLQWSFQRKPGYAKTVLRRRIPAIAKPFGVLIAVYWAGYALMGRFWSVEEVLSSLVNGSPIVRYGWYTECLLLLYGVFALCGWVLQKRKQLVPLAVLVMTMVLTAVLMGLGLPPFWYYSIPAFPLGCLWCAYGDRLVSGLKKRYPLWLAGSFLVFAVGFAGGLKTFRTGFFWLADLGLVLLAPAVLGKLRLGNRALTFLGSLSFEIYSFHGLFMLLYRSDPLYIASDLLWGCAVFASTIPSAWLLHRLTGKRLPQMREKSC